jgi:hypothetical protein
VSTLNALFDEQFSQKLDGGALEAVGRLFKRSVKVYVYPNLEPGGKILTLLDPAPSAPADHLRQLVLAFDHLRPLWPSDPALLTIHAPDVLARIRAADPAWIPLVPPSVAERIRAKQLFGHPG